MSGAPQTTRRHRPRVIVGVAAAVLFAGIQVIPAGKTNPPVTRDLIAATSAPEAEATLLRGACYDCHSHETRWPWYASVAPASWRTARHVWNGRQRLNLSDWPQDRPWDARARLESMAQALRAGSMPPADYRLLHPAAKLTAEQRTRLAAWLEATAGSLKAQRAP